jgi:hypothetical protein
MNPVTSSMLFSGVEIVFDSVADPGCLFRIPDPDFYPSRIPDPTRSKKDVGGKICLEPQISQNCNFFIFEQVKKKI